MQFIVYTEYRPEDFDKLLEKYRKIAEERKKFPGKFPKILFPPHGTGYCKGFVIYEADEEQANNLGIYYFPELKLKWVPITRFSKWLEQYLEMKK